MTNLQLTFLFFSSFIILLVISGIFYKLGLNRKDQIQKKVSALIPGSLLSLLGLLLSFTFSMSISRYEDRRRLVVDEANAIGTAYLRSQLLKGVDKEELRKDFIRYTEERIKYFTEDLSDERKDNAKHVQNKLWKQLTEIAKTDRTAMETIYADSLNKMFDASLSRNFALIKTLPYPLYIIIFFIACVAFATLCFNRGFEEEKSHWGTYSFLLIFTVLLALIHDIDHAKSGLIRISQDALLETRASL